MVPGGRSDPHRMTKYEKLLLVGAKAHHRGVKDGETHVVVQGI